MNNNLEKFKSPLLELKAYEKEEAAIYYLETLSACNLKCVMCSFGSSDLFERKQGEMSLYLFHKIVEQIAYRSPHAIVCPYHHCEPLLHKDLPEMVRTIKQHRLKCLISSNFNVIENLEDVLKAGPDVLGIAVSGFYQETYGKNHVGGDIEKVKANLIFLRKLLDIHAEFNVDIDVYYHMYKDNINVDFDEMKKFVRDLKFNFVPLWSRSIDLEMSLKHLREIGASRYKGSTLEWFDNIPKLKDVYKKALDRMVYLPEDYLTEDWKSIYIDECISNHRQINISWTGKIELCNCSFDDRLLTMDYLDCNINDFYKIKEKSPICKECLANNWVLYSNYFDNGKLDEIARKRLKGVEIGQGRFLTGINVMGASEILVFCRNYKYVYIYGHGYFGNKLNDYLQNNGIKCSGFVVSDGQSDDCEVVYELSQFEKIKLNETCVIVALNPMNRKQAMPSIERLNSDYCFVDYEFLNGWSL